MSFAEQLVKQHDAFLASVGERATGVPSGKFFEDFLVGEEIVHPMETIITKEAHELFCMITHNEQPIHTDEQAARRMGFDGIVVNGLFGLSIVVSQSIPETTAGTLKINLAYDGVSQSAPLHIGDAIRTKTTIVEIKPSSKSKDYGVVRFLHEGLKKGSGDEQFGVFTQFYRVAQLYTKEGYEKRIASAG
jgi:acyl dehydratase